jgi:hypothetical protein
MTDIQFELDAKNATAQASGGDGSACSIVDILLACLETPQCKPRGLRLLILGTTPLTLLAGQVLIGSHYAHPVRRQPGALGMLTLGR